MKSSVINAGAGSQGKVPPAYNNLSAYKILNQVKSPPGTQRTPVGEGGQGLERTILHKNQPHFSPELRARREHTTTDSFPNTAHNKTAGDKVEHISEHRAC